MDPIYRRAITAALYHHEDYWQRTAVLAAALEATAGPEIERLASPLVAAVHGLGPQSARLLLAAIGWKMIELES